MSQPVRSLITLLALAGSVMIANAQAPKAAPKAAPAAAPAKPPKPGLASCAGKIEGRYAASNGLPYTIEFRSGKASVNVPVMGAQETTCWTTAKKIYLYIPNDADPMEIDINDDGTLQTPFGELKKKGS